ncbi:Hypothetical_protein [Hexamita inflata]|uniref:Hypothetical_protein n=1 Tax=Hexamita inflata TaxID=28002 RepID=A0AA86TAV6_9EUKA|nr:Hypothetical protein HINF_LOCUS780 [Hexamita inflata]
MHITSLPNTAFFLCKHCFAVVRVKPQCTCITPHQYMKARKVMLAQSPSSTTWSNPWQFDKVYFLNEDVFARRFKILKTVSSIFQFDLVRGVFNLKKVLCKFVPTFVKWIRGEVRKWGVYLQITTGRELQDGICLQNID